MIVTDELLKSALEQAINGSVLKKEGKDDRTRKFDETLDLVINLRDIDVRNPNNRIDQEFLLPNAIHSGKMNICFIAKGDMVLAVRDKNYDVADEKFLNDISKKEKKTKKKFAQKYDAFVCQAPLMRTVAKTLGRFLGQMGKMPKPQPKGFGIVKPDENIDSILDNFSRRVKLQTKKAPLLQTVFGKKSLDLDKNLENLKSVLNLVESKMPNGVGNIKSIYIKTTMGPSTKVAEPAAKGKGGKKK